MMTISKKRLPGLVICLCLLCTVLAGCQSREAAAAAELIEALDIETPDGDAVKAAREAYDALSEKDRKSLENYSRLEEAETEYRADAVDALIGAVGKVTLESGPAVRAAREAYDALDEAARERVTRVRALTDAEETFHRLSVEDAAAKIDKLIDSIGEVTLESRDAVAAARAALEGADEEVLAAVRSPETVELAEDALHRLEAARAAAEFDELVDALGEITPESRDEVEKARAAYEEMDAEVRALVGTLPALEAAEERLVYLDDLAEAEKMDAAVNALGEITLESEADVRELRKQYDALPEEVRALMKRSGALDKAETAIQTLKDKAAAAEIKKLSDEKKYDEAIAYAETYMQGRPISEVKGGVVKNCLKAYAEKANALMKDSRNVEAYELLSGCRKTYADADLTDVNRSWDSLKKAIAEPKSGQIFSSTARGGRFKLTIKIGDNPTYIKFVNTKDTQSTLTVYLRANKSTTVYIKNGTYKIKYASGEKWYGTRDLFGPGTSCGVCDDTVTFNVPKGYIQSGTLTLKAVVNGNISTSPIPKSVFDDDNA